MKKKIVTIGALLLAMNVFGQKDTLTYNTNNQDTIKLQENDYVYLETYRDITLYGRNDSIAKIYLYGNNERFGIDGSFVKKVIVHKPKLR